VTLAERLARRQLIGAQLETGLFTWNGKVLTEAAEIVISKMYGGIDEWLMAVQLHTTFEAESAALKAHELMAPVVEFRYQSGRESAPQIVEAHESGLRRNPFVSKQFLTLSEFANANREYLASLKRVIDSHASGLHESNQTDDV
jgi:hypothetical protein